MWGLVARSQRWPELGDLVTRAESMACPQSSLMLRMVSRGEQTAHGEGVPLREAVEQLRAHGVPTNSYDWYRRDAQRHGKVWLGDERASATKTVRGWMVAGADVVAAVAGHDRRASEVTFATDEYRNGRLLGHAGDRIETRWGGYEVGHGFHFRWSDYEVGRRKSDGLWICSSCMQPAGTEHNSPECHRCSNWSPCHRDCTLSRIFCEQCATEHEIRSDYRGTALAR